ncbi:MAG: SAF domain-containing protein [Anaerolineae bacterium]
MNAPPKPPRDPWPWLYWGLFLMVVPLVALWMAGKPVPQVSLPVPARDLPPYRVITASDLLTATLPQRQADAESIRDPAGLLGHYTLETLPAGKPVRPEQLVAIPDPALITNTVAVAIPADAATILGGALRPGDVVAVAVVPADATAAPVRLLDAVLVLDVRQMEHEMVVLLAIPADRWPEYLARTRQATVVLARRVE